jgi:hypothetical protein
MAGYVDETLILTSSSVTFDISRLLKEKRKEKKKEDSKVWVNFDFVT